MAKYSMLIETQVMASITEMASLEETPSRSAIARGPTNLQDRSRRRIWELSSCRSCSLPWAMITTQSLSTEMVFMTELIFSIPASKDKKDRETTACQEDNLFAEATSHSSPHESAVATRCPTELRSTMMSHQKVRARSHQLIYGQHAFALHDQ